VRGGWVAAAYGSLRLLRAGLVKGVGGLRYRMYGSGQRVLRPTRPPRGVNIPGEVPGLEGGEIRCGPKAEAEAPKVAVPSSPRPPPACHLARPLARSLARPLARSLAQDASRGCVPPGGTHHPGSSGSMRQRALGDVRDLSLQDGGCVLLWPLLSTPPRAHGQLSQGAFHAPTPRATTPWAFIRLGN
jgi:hypothetical protein